ncbi:MAG: D-aminopeptidase [Halieaceae bacterium]|jgi:D-aminopeptidase
MISDNHRCSPNGRLRARGAGVPCAGTPGILNAITDVAGMEVGYSTLIQGEGALEIGRGPVRTGVTALLPRGRSDVTDGVFAGAFTLNGNGEMTGLPWMEETGRVEGPITLTNTHAVGIARDASIRWMNTVADSTKLDGNTFWMPLAGETCDNWLNDMNGSHVRDEQVFAAIDSARGGALAEGSVGGGTGMSCYQFKAGSGTASRLITLAGQQYTVGVFVQSNFGVRQLLTVGGIPMGAHFPYSGGQVHRYLQGHATDQGSIVAIIATDAPLMPHQLKRLARRGGIGMSRSGGIASNESGDFFVALSTANRPAFNNSYGVAQFDVLGEFMLTPLFEATIQAVDEAILNSLFAAERMVGRDGNVRDELPVDAVVELLKKHDRWQDPALL